MNRICKLFIIVTLLSITAFSFAETKFPNPTGYVNDFANVISANDERQITALASALERKTTAQLSVVTVKSVAPLDINSYAVDLFAQWGIGQKGKDNGVLVLLAMQERKVRIEVGYGLEGAIPDGLAGQIIDQAMLPHFRQGNFGRGVLAAAANIVDIIAKEYNVKVIPEDGLYSDVRYVRGSVSPIAVLFKNLLTLLFFIMFLGLRMGLFGFLLFGPRRGYWSGGGIGGGSFGGGFGGFGGGFSGGGGAMRGW